MGREAFGALSSQAGRPHHRLKCDAVMVRFVGGLETDPQAPTRLKEGVGMPSSGAARREVKTGRARVDEHNNVRGGGAHGKLKVGWQMVSTGTITGEWRRQAR